MAEIVGVFAASHTPVMTNLPHAPDAAVKDAAFVQFLRIGEEIAACQPDAVLLISDDHLHNFFLDCLPAFCIGAAEHYPTPVEDWLHLEKRNLDGHPALGGHLLEQLLNDGFDPALSMQLTLDHGFLTPLELAGVSGRWPLVPILVNCVQPPMPPMARCVALGRALRRGIEAFAGLGRVAVLATGGLSHDVGTPRMGMVNEDFDRQFLAALERGGADEAAAFAAAQVSTAGNGAEEVRNWLVAHGIAECAPFETYHYQAVHAWYTGIGVGRWRLGSAA